MTHNIIISCEHAGNRVPEKYRPLFSHAADTLKTHRGYDIGALSLARRLSALFDAPLFYSSFTRLLVDVNRSLHSRTLFSEFDAMLPPDEKKQILKTYYHPFRQKVESHALNLVAQKKQLLHLSVHTFTPVLKGKKRKADIGFLYDPSRPWEKIIVEKLANTFHERIPDFICRRNYPYRGISDSLAQHLRKKINDSRYTGIEIETNQKFPEDAKTWRLTRERIAEAMTAALAEI